MAESNPFLEGIQNVIAWAEFNSALKNASENNEGLVLDSAQVKAVAFGIGILAAAARDGSLSGLEGPSPV